MPSNKINNFAALALLKRATCSRTSCCTHPISSKHPCYRFQILYAVEPSGIEQKHFEDHGAGGTFFQSIISLMHWHSNEPGIHACISCRTR